MVVRIGLGSERRPVQGFDYLPGVQTALPRNRLDIAIVTGRATPQSLEYFHCLRVLLLHIAHDHTAMNQPVESKHTHTFRLGITAPVFQKFSSLRGSELLF